MFTALGEGVQIYDCTASAAGTGSNQFGWSFKEPRATLFDDEGNVVAVHYGGPTWQSIDNSRVMAKVVAKATQDPDAVPWLLLQASSNEGFGLFSTVTHIQRLYTVGGVAPSDGCDASHEHREVQVDYAVLYSFYGPKVPDELKVPDGKVLLFTALGKGVQIYTCTASTTATGSIQFGWAFKGPEAILFDDSGNVIRKHYAGPTWQANDNSKVVARLVTKVTPNPDAVPWLLLEATSNEGSGLFSRVTHIQRLYTAGGTPPSDGCEASHEHTDVRVDYAALYFFYGLPS